MSRRSKQAEASDMPYPAVPHRVAGSIELDAMVCEAVFVVRLRNAPQPNSDSLQHQLTCSVAIWIGSGVPHCLA